VHRSKLAGAAAVAALLAAACAVNPVTGRRQIALVTESQEIAMGAEADPQITAEFGLYDDAKLAAYVDAVGQKLARVSHRPHLQFHFRVLDSPVINAFALPGGYIYVTRGILAHMNNEAELAMVLGHEIGHVTARHGVEQHARQTLFGAGLGLGSLLAPGFARWSQAIQQGLGLLFLKYGRDDENQADDLGVGYSLAAGYDAEAGARFFEVLDRQSQESGQSLPGWLSTHPAPADRVQHTRGLAQQRHPQHPDAKRVAEADHKGRIDAVVFGEDPRQGFTDGHVFKHPQLRFQIDLPHGWQVQNTPSAVLAGSPDERAVLQLTLEKSDLTPSDYTARLAQQAGAQVVEDAAERIGGAPGHVAVLRVPAEGGGTVDVMLGCVRRDAGLFRLVGQTAPGAFAAHRDAFLGTIRSLRSLDDPAALRIEPNRVEVETLRSGTTLARAVERAGTLPVQAGTIALLNNLRPDSQLAAGFRLKLVRGAYRPAAGR
jgi:predicted Zn-dependent protease